MAIPKKGTRTITVEKDDYRWLIRRKATYSQVDYGDGMIHVAIEIKEHPGTTLHIITDRSHPIDWNTKEVTPVTPLDISNWIKQALDLDWKPKEKGKQFSVYIEDNQMKIRN